MLDLVFANFTVPSDSGLVTPDTYHPPLSTDVYLPHVNNNLNYECSYLFFAAGNYALFYNSLFTCDSSSVYETSSVDTEVASLNTAVRGAIEQTIPRGYSCKSKFPPWFSSTISYCIEKLFLPSF
jgi:hypothetical protein